MKNLSRRLFLTKSSLLLATTSIASPFSKVITSSNVSILRIGVIGTGARGTGLIKVLSEMPFVKIVALCDIQKKNLDNALQYTEQGVVTYTEYMELLANKNVDAVIIATPHFLHASMATEALHANKHIYLEKSLSFDIQESLDLVKLVRSKPELVFQVGFQYRNYALYHKVKEIINKGWIGKVTHFESQYNNNSNWRRPLEDPMKERIVNWRMYRESCGGLLTELCAHAIDAINFITDSHPVKVVGMGSINYWKDGRDTYDNVRVIYEFENGMKSSVTSVLSNGFNGYGIRILGDQGTIEIGRNKAFFYAEDKNKIRGTVDGVTGATIVNKAQGDKVEIKYLNEGEKATDPTVKALQNFIDCIIEKKVPISNVETAHITSMTLHMGNIAMDTGTMQTWQEGYYL